MSTYDEAAAYAIDYNIKDEAEYGTLKIGKPTFYSYNLNIKKHLFLVSVPRCLQLSMTAIRNSHRFQTSGLNYTQRMTLRLIAPLFAYEFGVFYKTAICNVNLELDRRNRMSGAISHIPQEQYLKFLESEFERIKDFE